MAKTKSLFVTVGTTEFEALIKEVTKDKTLSALADLGFTDVTLQIGKGQYEPKDINGTNASSSSNSQHYPKVHYYRLKDSIADDIDGAYLVISHAGAGSVLDCLNAGKRLLVVINDELMGNHQTELAEKLSDEGHLHYCTVSNLESSLWTLSWDCIKTFPPGQPEKLTKYLDKCFGFD